MLKLSYLPTPLSFFWINCIIFLYFSLLQAWILTSSVWETDRSLENQHSDFPYIVSCLPFFLRETEEREQWEVLQQNNGNNGSMCWRESSLKEFRTRQWWHWWQWRQSQMLLNRKPVIVWDQMRTCTVVWEIKQAIPNTSYVWEKEINYHRCWKGLEVAWGGKAETGVKNKKDELVSTVGPKRCPGASSHFQLRRHMSL